MLYVICLVFGALVGVLAVGIFGHRSHTGVTRKTVYRCMVGYGISPSTAELVCQAIEEELYGEEKGD